MTQLVQLVKDHWPEREDFLHADLVNKIEAGGSKARLLLVDNSESAAGAIVFKNNLSHQYAERGIKDAIEVEALAFQGGEDDISLLKVNLDPVIKEITHLTAALRPKMIYILLKPEQRAIASLLRSRDFYHVSIGDKSDHELFVCKMSSEPRVPVHVGGGVREGASSLKRKGREEVEDPTVTVKRQKLEDHLRPVAITLRKVYIGQIQRGLKTIEGRINSGMFKNLRVGSVVRFFYQQNPSDDAVCKVTRINRYSSFKEMLEKEDYKKCIADATSMHQAVQIYDAIPGYSAKAAQHGVLAIHIENVGK